MKYGSILALFMTIHSLKVVEFAERSRPPKELIVGILQRLGFAN